MGRVHFKNSFVQISAPGVISTSLFDLSSYDSTTKLNLDLSSSMYAKDAKFKLVVASQIKLSTGIVNSTSNENQLDISNLFSCSVPTNYAIRKIVYENGVIFAYISKIGL
jgi:hypothetical protein